MSVSDKETYPVSSEIFSLIPLEALAAEMIYESLVYHHPKFELPDSVFQSTMLNDGLTRAVEQEKITSKDRHRLVTKASVIVLLLLNQKEPVSFDTLGYILRFANLDEKRKQTQRFDHEELRNLLALLQPDFFVPPPTDEIIDLHERTYELRPDKKQEMRELLKNF